MKALAAKGIVHRDLKPQNILITYDRPNPPPSEIQLKIGNKKYNNQKILKVKNDKF